MARVGRGFPQTTKLLPLGYTDLRGYFTADAVILKTQTGTSRIPAFQANAFQVSAFQTFGPLTADASIVGIGTGSFTANAVLKATRTGSLTADAVLLRTQTGSFTANVVVLATRSGSFTANAVLLATRTGSFTADAVVLATRSVTFTADAILLRNQTGSLTADAVVLASRSGSFTADAYLDVGAAHSFTVDAVLLRTFAGSFTADAVLKATRSATFTADAILLASRTGSFTADAVLRVTRTGSLTASACILRTQTGSFTANAVLKAQRTGSFTADAYVPPPAGTGLFTASAVIKTTVPTTFCFIDDFERTVPEWDGWENAWVDNNAGNAAVDGSHGVSQAHQYIYMGNPAIPAVDDFDVRFDFETEPVGPTSRDWSQYIYLESGSSWMDQYSVDPPDATPYEMEWEVGSNAVAGSTAGQLVVDAGEWYSVHWQQSNGITRVRVWKQGDPEPSTWLAENAIGTPVAAFRWEVDGGYQDDTLVDNFSICTTVPAGVSFTADAVITPIGFRANAIQLATMGAGSTDAPAYQSAATGSSSSNTTGTAKPSGMTAGDLLVSFISFDAGGDTSKTWTSQTGDWTRIGRAMLASGDHCEELFVHIATGSEPTLLLWDATGSAGDSVVATLRISGAGADLNRYFVGTKIGVGSGNNHSTDYITSTVDGLLILGAAGSVGTNWTPPSGMTERTDSGSTVSQASLETSTLTVTTGDIGIKTAVSVSNVPDDLIWLVIPPPGFYFRAAARIAFRIKCDAVIKRTGMTGSFTADAQIARGFFRCSAVIKATGQTATFTANAAIKKGGSGSFTADAYLAVNRTGSFTADAATRSSGSNSFTVDYAWWVPGVTPTPPLIGVPSRIFVNGVEYSQYIMWRTASFSAKVNGQSGECSFDVVDRNHDLSFEFGDEVQLYIDGILRWGGWILQATRTFPFPVQKAPTTDARIWHIGGTDYNRFLDRRVLHDDAHPNRTWDYAAGTHDDVIFNDIWQYFDTAGFTKNIHHVADGVLDIKGVTGKTGGNVAQGGFYMRDVLLHLSWDTGAIFYVTPTKVVTYVDADLVSNPYTLTDQPSGPMDVGFHDVKIIEDSTEMVNDAIVWGAGKGSANVVNARRQSVPSQVDHGRWQAGDYTAGIYKQATANAVAQSRIDGSPESKRGAKNPKRAVELLTWEPVFGVGDVVNFHDSQFFLPPADPDDPPSHDDVLPIRTMTITWPTPYQPLFALQLSWEVDAVWSFFDPWLPITAAGPGGNGGGVDGRGGDDPPPGCDDCGITDAFDRTVLSGAGTADSREVWTDESIGTAEVSVDPTDGLVLDASSPDGGFLAAVQLPITQVLETVILETELYANHAPDPGTPNSGGSSMEYIQWLLGDDLYIEVGRDETSSNQPYLFVSRGDAVTHTAHHTVDYTLPFKLGVTRDADGATEIRIWQSSTNEPASPTVSFTYFWAPTYYYYGAAQQALVGATSHFIVKSSYLDIAGVTRCSAPQFENFERVVTGAWATSSSGITWEQSAFPGEPTMTVSVDGSAAIITHAGTFGGANGQMETTDQPEAWSGDLTLRSRFTITDAEPGQQAHFAMGMFDEPRTAVVNHAVWFQKNLSGITDNDKITLLRNDGTGYQVDHPWVIGTTYDVIWEKTGDTQRAKAWPVGTAEPVAWDIALTGIVPMTPGGFNVSCNNSRTSGPSTGPLVVEIEYIDLDYVGRPCFNECTPDEVVDYDTFQRTIASGFGTNDRASAYAVTFATGAYGVNGSQLYCGNGSTSGNFTITNPDVSLFSGDFIMTVSFTIPSLSFIITDGVLLLHYRLTSSTTQWVQITAYQAGVQRLELNAGFWSEEVPISITAGVEYLMKWDTRYGVKVWAAADPEPATWDVGLVTPSLVPTEFLMSMQSQSAPKQCLTNYITVQPLECLTIPQSGGTGGVPAGTHLTDIPEPLSYSVFGTWPSGSLWQVTNSILPGSPLLSIDNVIQYGNWTVYDADHGIVQINEDVTSLETIRVIYVTNGAIT